MPLGRYTVLTTIGSALWCFGIAGAGVALGSSWEHFHEQWRYADYAVVARSSSRRSATAFSSTPGGGRGAGQSRARPKGRVARVAIPLTDVRAQYAPLLDEVKERIAEVLDSGRFILGPEVKAFEEEAARFIGAENAVGVANGTDALVLVLDALGVGPGDEVVCPSFTFYATAESIARRGATPVFADIDPATLNLDAADVAAKVTERTKAILPVHLFGRPAGLAALPDSAPLVEDAAQAFGAPRRRPSRRVGRGRRDVQLLSDQESVRTRGRRPRHDRYRRARRAHPSSPLPRLARQADVRGGRLQLAPRRAPGGRAPHLPPACRRVERDPGAPRRRATGSSASARSASFPPTSPATCTTCTSSARRERERLTAALDQAGIGWAAYYTTPLHLQPALAELGYAAGSLPETERAARETLALPIWPAISREQQERVVECLRAASTEKAA